MQVVWGNLIGATATAILILGGLGLPLALIVGLRGLWAVAIAPAFAITVISGSAILAGFAGVPWSVLPAAALAALIGVVVWVIRRSTGLRPAPAPRRAVDLALIIALAAAGALIAMQFVSVLGRPDAISQTFDDIFHLNAVRYVLDTGSASSLTLGQMTFPGGGLAFYPAAWHGLAALVVQLSGVALPVAVNAVTLVIAAIVWPLGAVLLTRTLFGRSRALTVTAALVSASLPVFPLLLMDYGVLYPFQLGVSLLPGAIAATIRLLRIVPRRETLPPWATGIVLAGILPGMAVAHPGAFVAWLALTAPAAVVFFALRWRGAAQRVRVWLVATFTVYLAVGAVLVRVLRPPFEARQWPTSRTPAAAVVDVATFSPWYGAPAVLVAILVVLGIAACIVRRSAASATALGMYVVAAGLYFVVSSLTAVRLRDALTGSWYNDLPRVASFLAVVAVPLAAYGAAWSLLQLRRSRVGGTIVPRLPATAARLTGVAAVLVLAAGLQLGPLSPVTHAVNAASDSFRMDEEAPLLSADEIALLARVPQHVPVDVAIAGSPWTGASLAYALSDRRVLMPHTLMLVTDPLQTINDDLADARPGAAVCQAIAELGVGYVLDFPGPEVHGGRHDFPGLDDLEESGAVRLVDQQGNARLYEIVGCRS